MAVMTSQKTQDPTEQNLTMKELKSHYKTRPITATLEHPLILDIKLLKRLDMTTFTKKGLIALSKFCGISLITKTDTKRKFNKCVVKSNALKKANSDVTDGATLKDAGKKDPKGKRKRKQISKPGTRIRFKITEGNVSVDEDSADVVCKNHKVTNNRLTKPPGKLKPTGRKSFVNEMINATIENIIPEPCKTCCRSEHPERFHSHPKTSTKFNLGQETNEKNVEVCTLATNNSVKGRRKKKMEKKSGAKEHAFSQALLSTTEGNSQKIENTCPDGSSAFSTTQSSASAMSTPEAEKEPNLKLMKKIGSEVKLGDVLKNAKEEKGGKVLEKEEEDALKYITGCYVCGKQISPKARMKHEESCILEWRAKNSLLSPDKRKPEPRRPDFRFTGSGTLDCQGTFESIWANHKDSLVPCGKCGRTFFPDRIQKHEKCCTNVPLCVKNKN